MKKLIAMLLALVMVMALAACGAPAAPAAPEAPAVEPVTLNVAYMPNYSSLVEVVTGIEMGYFAEEGITINLVEFADGPTIIAAMEAESIDIGYIGSGAHKLCIAGRAKIFAFAHCGNGDAVIGLKSKGVNSAADLKGKVVGYSAGTSSEAILQKTLASAGLTMDDITAMEMDASGLVSAMVSGSLDACALWSPSSLLVLEQCGDDAFVIADNLTFADQSASVSSWIVMEKYLDDNKQWIDINHPLSFRGFMNRTVYSKIKPELNVPEDHRVFPDPNNVEYIPNLIEKLGGVDICFGGIGINGHLAFNEADGTKTCDEFKALKTRVLPISPETRAANAIGDFGGRLEDMPVWCVTIGFNEIYNSRKIRLGIFRDWHRAVARRCGYGEMAADFPVSMVAEHPDALIRMTEFVANLED